MTLWIVAGGLVLLLAVGALALLLVAGVAASVLTPDDDTSADTRERRR